ncbi:MAG: single-stranded DNA-binding protein [Parcubacteria group bacterium]|nr:single-stranded DNA-binding protein [Parcubacteria group bacterium]
MNINKVILFGNLTRDPEIKALPSGMQVATFGVATNRVFRDRTGNKQEQADFHNIVVFGRQAETVSQYLKKGNSAFIEGRIQTRTWEKDGEKRSRTEIVAERVQFGPKGGTGGSEGGSRGGFSGGRGKGGGKGAAPVADEGSSNGVGIEYPAEEINPDDIPF